MDVFKLAFETTIVGLLAFLWLGLATDLLFPNFFMRVFGTVPDKYQTPLGVGALLLAYCLGSAILPISSQLLNDEHWPLSEDAIRCMVFVEHERQRVETDPAEALKPEARFSAFTTCHKFILGSRLFLHLLDHRRKRQTKRYRQRHNTDAVPT
jgi:hypothetical protein